MTTTQPLTRRQFYARMRKLGFAKGMQFARNGVSYSQHNVVYSVDEGIIQVPVPCPPRWWGVTARTVTVTVPKRHEEQFHIIGDVPVSGIYVLHPDAGGKAVVWGHPINPADIGCQNMFEVCLGLCDGSLFFGVPEDQLFD
jgi:hypothetical protein